MLNKIEIEILNKLNFRILQQGSNRESSRSNKKYGYGYGSAADHGICGGCKVPMVMMAAVAILLVLVAVTVRTSIMY
jgi:hypothetical protein